MSRFRLGEKPLRLLVLLAMVTALICGCSGGKYAPVETLAVGESAVAAAETVAFTIGETVQEQEETVPAETEAESAEEETISYEVVHDWIVVTADVLNVRAEDNTNARIYIQLKTGDILERIGYHEEWSQVVYDDGIAYVATAMVEVTEEPFAPVEESENAAEPETAAEPEETAESIESEETSGIPVYRKTGTSQQAEPEVPFNGHIVAIDAGHQAKANAEKEPIGPGSTTKKAKMPEGAVGAATGVKEYELTLTVAQKLEKELISRGYQVVMIRNGHDVNLSNAERSRIANESDAEIFIRLHANSMDNSSVYGALAMCMTEYNPYNSELHTDSYSLSKKIINNICSLTGTKNRGVQKVDNSSAINWCQIPVSVVELGFLTNPDEDRWLQSEDYQGKIVDGISKAVDAYFTEKSQ